MGFYILRALSLIGNNEKALELIRRYWGAMLELGATTFWEEFKPDWAENAARIDETVPEGKDDIARRFRRVLAMNATGSACVTAGARRTNGVLIGKYCRNKILEPGMQKTQNLSEPCGA